MNEFAVRGSNGRNSLHLFFQCISTNWNHLDLAIEFLGCQLDLGRICLVFLGRNCCLAFFPRLCHFVYFLNAFSPIFECAWLPQILI